MRLGKVILRKSELILIGIFILSLSLRFIYLYQLKSTPLFGFFALDSSYYDEFAMKILAGNFTAREMTYLNALYPFFLAGIYRIFGHNITAVVSIQIILDSLSCILLYLICMIIFNKKSIGLLTSFIYGCYNIAIFYTGFLLGATLVTFLNVLLILTLLYATHKRKSIFWFLSGAIFGLSMLLMPHITLFLPFLLIWVFYPFQIERIRKDVVNLCFIFTGIFLILLPFSMRNYAIEKRFSPLPVLGGINFYRGNNPSTTGVYSYIEGISSSPVKETMDSIRIAEKEIQRKLSPQEASNYWFKKGLQFIKNNPRQYLILLLRKLLLFWNEEEVSLNLNYYFCRRFTLILKFPLFSFGFIAPFALLGFIFAMKDKLADLYQVISFIFAYMVSLLLFFISDRYRFPCVPFVMILGSYAFYRMVLLVKSFKIRELVLFFVLFLGFFIIVNKDIRTISSEDYYFESYLNLGRVYSEKGMFDEAISETQKAIKINPNSADAYNNLGAIYAQRGMLDKAMENFRRAIKINPDDAEFHYNLGNVYADKSMLEESIKEYQKTIEIETEHASAHYNIAVSYYGKGDFERATYHCNKAIEYGFEVPSEFLEALKVYYK